MGIEFSQIHNLLRTYQRILNVPPSKAPHGGSGTKEVGDRVSISPEAREQESPSRTDSTSGAFHQQDKECPI